jgi:ABC-type cobalt transport system substrate-binding protein
MQREISAKVAWLIIGIVALAAGLWLWWMLAGNDSTAGGKVEVIPPGYNPLTGQQLK